MTRNHLFVASSMALVLLGVAATANAQNSPEVAPSPPAGGAPPAAAEAAPAAPAATAAAAPAAMVTDHPGVSLSARLAYAVPMGSAAQNLDLSSGVSGGLPIVIEGAYRFNRNISAGLYGQYGYMLAKNCPAGVSCSDSDYRIGVEGIYNLRLGSTIDPWVGLGVGYEWLSTSASAGGMSMSETFSGFELATLSAGGDFAAASQVAVGPFISFSIGKYGSASVNGTSGDIANTAYHQWLQLGVRGTFNL